MIEYCTGLDFNHFINGFKKSKKNRSYYVKHGRAYLQLLKQIRCILSGKMNSIEQQAITNSELAQISVGYKLGEVLEEESRKGWTISP
jgi:hypothetical protein